MNRLEVPPFVDRVVLPQADAVVSISRLPGLDEQGKPRVEPLSGNVLPRLCQFAGREACKAVCQAPEGYDNSAKDCAKANGYELFEKLKIDADDVYLGVVTGSANVVFLDKVAVNEVGRNPEGYKSFPATDAVFGYADTVKACRLADCGMLVVTGLDKAGRPFDGFIYATRGNLNGDDQFENEQGERVGGIESMLNNVVKHYQPQELTVRLVAGIRPDLYLFDFTPNEKELVGNPGLTVAQKRENMFKGWQENGWIAPHIENGGWDGRTYEIDMLAAIRHQVERAGLTDVYDDSNAKIDGDLAKGHASNTAGIHDKVPEARDFYLVIPHDYSQRKK